MQRTCWSSSRGSALLLALQALVAAGVCPECEHVVGDTRVQALSPTLLRVEPRGPRGFEDRSTFMVVDRSSWTGLPLRVERDGQNETQLATSHYKILIRHEGGTGRASFAVAAPDGSVLCDTSAKGGAPSSLLHWPSPLSARAYSLEDSPRFFVPSWTLGPVPAGAQVDPELQATHGYDFRNDVGGDTYVFLLGDTLEDWKSSRGEFLQLTGPTPILPDYAYGTWFTQWRRYTEVEAKYEVEQWDAGRFPLDVWGLDMNWRLTGPGECRSQRSDFANCSDHFYNYPATSLFPDFEEWFRWLKARGLRTYFNDHPFPRDVQTAPEEVSFRWEGLSSWIAKGIDFWWFDHNWPFTVPPPTMPKDNAHPWEGLTSQVWGSHLYYEVTKHAIANRSGGEESPLALSRDNGPFGWRAGMAATASAAVPAQHRYPAWWTGDGVLLNASVESMVDQGMHDFRAFTHSDCGGHQPNVDAPNAAAHLMRWTAHCVFGTILRFHQGEHRFWLYSNSTQDVVRKYLETRYRLIPSLISAGKELQLQGLPLVARCDFYWPDHPEASNNTQYIHLNDTLVAPIGEDDDARDVWIPPGQWQDAWSGSIVTGPQTLHVVQPANQIPMWHRRGGFLILAGGDALRVAKQDWSDLTIDAFPAANATSSTRRLDLGAQHSLQVELATSSPDHARLTISAHTEEAPHAWLLRVHLLPGRCARRVTVDGQVNSKESHAPAGVGHLLAGEGCRTAHFPFAGAGSGPACGAGPIAEVRLPPTSARRVVDVLMGACDEEQVLVFA